MIPIRNIVSVKIKKPGFLSAGFIEFSISSGRVPVRGRLLGLPRGTKEAARDEYSVVFRGKASYAIALQIKDYVANYTEAPSPAASTNVSTADEIMKLKALMDQGVISAEEFAAKKHQLLSI